MFGVSGKQGTEAEGHTMDPVVIEITHADTLNAEELAVIEAALLHAAARMCLAEKYGAADGALALAAKVNGIAQHGGTLCVVPF